MPSPRNLRDFADLLSNLAAADAEARAGAETRNAQLTKPPAALGRLEDIAIWVAGWQGTDRPAITAPQIIIFAGNHGVTAQGVSAFPAEVTAQMVLNFEHGGAAINQLARAAGARLDVHALDLDRPTGDFTEGAAMSDDECAAALSAGWDAVADDTDLLVVGEMGIGNTTAAAAICTLLFGGDWVGRGTGVDDAGLARKADVVARAASRHAGARGQGLATLARVGGREIAAMAGAILRARHAGIPVVLDGFICSAAAACLQADNPQALDHCVAGHQSAEGAHARLLAKLGKEPLLSLGMRLGEGSGAAVAINIVKCAVACHSGMATFAEAGVSDA